LIIIFFLNKPYYFYCKNIIIWKHCRYR